MSTVIAEDITHVFGTQQILRNVSFRLGEVDRIGLTGANGEGKTTLLRIIAGKLEPTGGCVHRRRGLRMAYLPQSTPEPSGDTVYDTMLGVFADLRRKEKELDTLAGQINGRDDSDGLLKRYGKMQAQFEALGGYDYTRRIEQVLTGLGFDRELWTRPLSTLSGGQQTRAHLGTLLLSNSDVMMLDEPTNHLDLNSVEGLENWTQSFRGALIVVSHDRYFLDRVTTATWEIGSGTLEMYRGSYSAYVTKCAERNQQRMRQWQAQQEYIAKTKDYIARHIAGQRTKEAQGRRKHLERFLRDEAVARPQRRRTMNLTLLAGRRTGDMVLRAEHLVVGYDPSSPLLKTECLDIERGQCVAIIGPNGSGKTTLLRTLLGELPPLSGRVHRVTNADVGYLSQTHAELGVNDTVLEVVKAVDPRCTDEQARTLLGALLIGEEDVFKRIGELSGGQRSRVALARLVLTQPNLLALDEPTNHLDIPSMEIIQNMLKHFDGTILLVSHDRYLIQAVATDVWVIDGDQIHCVVDGWQGYCAWRNQRREASLHIDEVDREPAKAKTERKAAYQQARRQSNHLQRLRRQYDQLEVKIDALERDLVALNEQISQAGQVGDLERVERLGREYQRKQTQLKALWDQWEHVGGQLE